MRPSVELLDWGTIDYAEALERQRKLFDRLINEKEIFRQSGGYATLSRKSQGSLHDVNDRSDFRGRRRQNHCYDEKAAGWLVMCEHPPVYTLGRSGRAENLLVGEDFLHSRGAALHRVERGGDITFHGPGQIVGYPVLDLEKAGLGLRRYIEALEQAVIDTVAAFGIRAERVTGKTGVWVKGKNLPGASDYPDLPPSSARHFQLAARYARTGYAPSTGGEFPSCADAKLCAMGVRASRGVVMHGFALNVATDLEWFELINPCGMAGSAVTSMERETGRRIALDEVKRLLTERLTENLGIRVREVLNRSFGTPEKG